MVMLNIFGNRLVLKRNPWNKIDKYLVHEGKDWILSHVVPWAGAPELRPRGVKAINDIFKYIASHSAVKSLHPAARVRVIGDAMRDLDTKRSKGDIDNAIQKAITDHAEYVAKPVRLTKIERAAEIKARAARIPAYEALAAALR